MSAPLQFVRETATGSAKHGAAEDLFANNPKKRKVISLEEYKARKAGLFKEPAPSTSTQEKPESTPSSYTQEKPESTTSNYTQEKPDFVPPKVNTKERQPNQNYEVC